MAVGDRMARQTSFSVGDKVRWKTGDSNSYGRIVGKKTSGTASSSGGEFSRDASEEKPAYEVKVASFADGSWTVDGKTTVHRASELTKIDGFPENGPSNG